MTTGSVFEERVRAFRPATTVSNYHILCNNESHDHRLNFEPRVDTNQPATTVPNQNTFFMQRLSTKRNLFICSSKLGTRHVGG